MQPIRCFLVSALLAGTAVPTVASEKSEADTARPDQAMLEQQFAEKLTGSALVGNFTVDGQAADKPLKPERYEISKARKLEGDTWEITARIKYGQVDVQVPIQLDVLWAGDTPVMSLTDLKIPLMEGSFTARVLFYGDRYVGTWQHGKVGGHMFGHVERADADGEEPDAAAAGEPVSGMVTLNGQPVAGALVEFVTADGKRKSVSAETDQRGQFELKLPAGKHRVRIEKERRPVGVPARDSDKSPFRVDVKAGRNVFDFRLKSP